MFDKFGELNYEGLNAAAAGQKAEGDLESLKALAVENGLDPEDAEDYYDAPAGQLCPNPFMAASAKLKIETKDLQLPGLLQDWVNLIIEECQKDDQLSLAVREPQNELLKAMAKILKKSFDTKTRMDDRIVKAAGLNTPIYFGIPGRKDVKQIIREYYLGGAE